MSMATQRSLMVPSASVTPTDTSSISCEARAPTMSCGYSTSMLRTYQKNEWNRFENYYPGDDWMDWVGVSVYGAAEPTDDEWIEFRQPMDDVYARLAALTEKPIAVLEFGVTSGNPLGDQANWTRAALTDLIDGRWPRVIGLSWWNEGWQNDDNAAHDTDMWIQNNPELGLAFKELVRN